MAVVRGLGHHGITVPDLDSAVDFFTTVFDFRPSEVIELGDGFATGVTGVAGARIRVAFVTGPGFAIELLEYSGPEDRATVGSRPCDVGSTHLALYVDDIADVASRSRAFGWDLANRITPIVVGPRAGGRAAYLISPFGAVLELVELPEDVTV